VFDTESVDADRLAEPWGFVKWRVALGERDAHLEREPSVVSPDATAFELIEGRWISVSDLKEAVTGITGVPNIVEGAELFGTLNAFQPDAIVVRTGRCGLGRCRKLKTHCMILTRRP
jgi:hypothetical protein